MTQSQRLAVLKHERQVIQSRLNHIEEQLTKKHSQPQDPAAVLAIRDHIQDLRLEIAETYTGYNTGLQGYLEKYLTV